MNKNREGTSNIGLFVGKAERVTIRNCHAEGTIITDGTSANIGGFAGSMDGGEIENSTVNVRIIRTEDNIFNELRVTLEQIEEADEKQKLIKIVDNMENTIGKPIFNEKYKAFVSNASAHFTLLSPFVTKLAEYIM